MAMFPCNWDNCDSTFTRKGALKNHIDCIYV